LLAHRRFEVLATAELSIEHEDVVEEFEAQLLWKIEG
jgi:hypothetical protein